MKTMPLLALLLLSIGWANGEFGDFADLSYNCPAFTTCQQICVTTVEECPPEARCPNEGEQLCADGSCAEECDEGLETPCAYKCASVACYHDIVDTLNSCRAQFGDLYAAEAECGALEDEESVKRIKFSDPFFMVVYAWLVCVTLSVVAWCAFNNRFSRVPDSKQPFELDHKELAGGVQLHHQTGFKRHPIGIVLHLATMLTMVGFFVLMIWLTLEYYILQESRLINFWTGGMFQDEKQLLAFFEAIFCVGFVWTFAFKWPYSIESLFLRRCLLSEATHVAVYVQATSSSSSAETMAKDAPDQAVASASSQHVYSEGHLARLRTFFQSFQDVINVTMSCVFSDVDGDARRAHETPGVVYQYCPVHRDPVTGTRYFVFLFRRYNLQQEGDNVDTGDVVARFLPAQWSVGTTVKDLIQAGVHGGSSNDKDDGDTPVKTLQTPQQQTGLPQELVEERRRVVGPNTIEVPKPTIFGVLFQELSKPFYIYQAYLIFSWVPLWYYYMAIVYGTVATSSLLTVSFFRYRNLYSLYKLSKVTGECTVLRDGKLVKLHPRELVPGDLVQVQPGYCYADLVCVPASTDKLSFDGTGGSGGQALVDESALTGESTPKSKTALDPSNGEDAYDPKRHKRHTISAGTTVLESEHGLMALVLQTGSYTSRGELLREIFSYTRHQFKFDVEVIMVITILFFWAIFGFSITIHFIQDDPVYGWFYGIYVVAAALPALLPAVFTVSVGVSDDRLSRKNITCTNPESILVAGKVQRAFFDKTGTLTHPGLVFVSARGGNQWKQTAAATTSRRFSSVREIQVPDEMVLGMTTCHSLSRSSKTGKVVGNPVDVHMFEATGAQLVEAPGAEIAVLNTTGETVSVLKRFDFDHHSMTQSVIVKDASGALIAVVKGSGESIQKLCLQDTMPDDFDFELRESSRAGIYQISVAQKQLPEDTDVANVKREELEKELSFVGVINFKNIMRPESPNVIRQLAEGEVKSTMVTGDNVLTGIRIAKEAGIIEGGRNVLIGAIDRDGNIVWTNESDEPIDLPTIAEIQNSRIDLAMSGALWGKLRQEDPKHAMNLAESIRVFGRCTPQDKVSVVGTFVELGFVTAMCGDGSNDSGALKTAHVGIALSDAEASLVAPFASLDKSIESVVEVLREGRCALASALASYKFMIMYGQITTMNQIVTAYFQVTFGEWNWAFLDGVWVVSLAFSLPLARAAKKLAPSRPTASVLGLQTLASVLGPLAFHYIFAAIGLYALHQQDWYQCRKWGSTDVSNVLVIADNYEAQVVFFITGYQLISSAIAYNFGYEFRQGWFRNYVFVSLVTGFTTLHLYALLVPGKVSCFFRANCVNEDVVRSVISKPFALQNSFNHTMMPEDFRITLLVILISNTVAVVMWEYFVVNGIRQRAAAAERRNKNNSSSNEESTSSSIQKSTLDA